MSYRESGCEWPHEILDPSEHSLLAQYITRYERVIEIEAKVASFGNAQLALDLAQAARIELWMFGVGRIQASRSYYIKRTIKQTIREARRTDWIRRGGKRRKSLNKLAKFEETYAESTRSRTSSTDYD